MDEQKRIQEVPTAEAEKVSSVVQFSKDCNIIPAKDGKIGHQEDVIYVEETRIVDGEPIQTKMLYTKDNQKIGYVDLATGAVVFEESYRDKLKEMLGEELYNQLGLDDRTIKMEDIINGNQFVEVTLDKEIDGLTKEEIENILREHGSNEFRDSLEAKLYNNSNEDSEKEEERRNKIADDIGLDRNEIESIDEIRDRTASSILQKGKNTGWPLEIKMRDGSIKYVDRNQTEGKYEELEGFIQEINPGQYTNYIDVNGRVQKAQVLSRTYNKENPNESISMIKTNGGQVITVVEKTADGKEEGIASISREMETESNSSRHISGNVRDLVDNAEPEDIIAINMEISRMTEGEPLNTVDIKDLETVEDRYKKGLVEEEQLNKEDENGEKQPEDYGDQKTPWSDVEERRNRLQP